MKKGTGLARPTVNEMMDLVSWIFILTHRGQKTPDETVAILASKLLSEPNLLSVAEGRKLLAMTKTRLKGTHWYEVVFPKPLSDEDRAREKEFDRLAEEMQEQLPKIEYFFNEVLPNTELQGE